jgi:formyltetrahydrofolate-dependent phosphoribosylglycinamide formyltransferase
MDKILPKLAVLISGNGSNLQSMIEHIRKGLLQAQIVVVISNQADAYGLHRAHKAGIPTIVVDHNMFENRKLFDRALLKELARFDVEWVILSGFMRILGTEFLSKYTNKVVNIHPSLLPKYPGLQAIQKAFENVESETGVTVHYVNEGVDTGSIIMQEKVEITADDTLETLEKKIHQVEHQIYPKAIQKVLWGKG